jgi:uncharacterized protein YndB with AHSA1/START domain
VKTDIEVTQTFPHPIRRVWAALTTSEALADWLMPNDFAAVAGHRFTLHTKPRPGFDGTVHCTVVELVAPSRMVWSWTGGPLDTMITFELTELDEHTTHLHLHHAGFTGLGAQLARAVMARGWRRIGRRRLAAHLDLRTGRAPARPGRPHQQVPTTPTSADHTNQL